MGLSAGATPAAEEARPVKRRPVFAVSSMHTDERNEAAEALRSLKVGVSLDLHSHQYATAHPLDLWVDSRPTRLSRHSGLTISTVLVPPVTAQSGSKPDNFIVILELPFAMLERSASLVGA